MVDRFYNGDKSNDHKVMDPVYDAQDLNVSGGGDVHPIVHSSPSEPANYSLDYGQLDFYGGDLQGIIKKLPYLKKLGVNALYLMPIFQAATNHGYDAANYMQIAPHLGTLKTFKALVKALHK